MNVVDGDSPEFEEDDTTQFVRRARSGDDAARDWIVRRFSSLFLVEADEQIGRRGLLGLEASDVVHDAWLVILPRLAEIHERNGRVTPSFVRYFRTVMANAMNQEHRRDAKRPRVALHDLEETVIEPAPPFEDGLRRLVRAEQRGALLRALLELPAEVREIVLRRAAGDSGEDIAADLGKKPNTVTKAYTRTRDEFLRRFPDSFFADLEA